MLPAPPDGLSLPDGVESRILAAYGESQRAYHDVSHLLDVLARFAEVQAEGLWRQPREVFCALLFHDAVYEPGAHDNELRSAVLARDTLVTSTIDIDRVEHLIALTARHGQLSPNDVDAEAALFVDCDMAILGAPADVFDRYERGVAKEYSALAPEVYVAGRLRFVERLLSEERIFLSDRFHLRFDAAARANLRRSRDSLAGGEESGAGVVLAHGT